MLDIQKSMKNFRKSFVYFMLIVVLSCILIIFLRSESKKVISSVNAILKVLRIEIILTEYKATFKSPSILYSGLNYCYGYAILKKFGYLGTGVPLTLTT